MLEFVLANIAMVSVGVVLFLIAHSLPRVGERETEPKWFIERWITSEVPEKLDGAFNSFAGKFLRKLRVVILKFDNLISESLKKFKSGSSANKQPLDFKEMMGDKEGDEAKAKNENEDESKRKKGK
ncbi:MAG: hypothetical protein HYY10_01035 [Candidatus Liptonbacteria bacterium]|nr:hypothetical protein [Candidatus Liptonbacteria bacterium]